jgi:hypothetical protein
MICSTVVFLTRKYAGEEAATLRANYSAFRVLGCDKGQQWVTFGQLSIDAVVPSPKSTNLSKDLNELA